MYLNCGDDCFTLKAGRGEDGLRIGRPTENVVIRYSLARQGHGGITVGSETAAMIRNLYVHDVVFDDTEVGLRFKTRRPRGGGEKTCITSGSVCGCV
ncbi:glycosyl hydrolase family 28 protein [Chitinophaga pinensis]|uniref:glycosyl hydrolase family 28 protein n=1 Tax=Chitinophaga pinensis TaxID=79329 RepID=UPI001C98F941|nr:glycosyl hydrolase family 28 protein [Chitinophaga pinensis]